MLLWCGVWHIRETKFWQQIHNNWKEKEKYSKKNENSSKYVPVSALTKNTHESLFAAALARLGQSCIGAQERITSQQSHTLSVMQPTCQPSGPGLSVSVQLTEHCRGAALSHKFRVQQQTRARDVLTQHFHVGNILLVL